MAMLDLGLLRALDAFLQEEGVTRAARRLGLSVPAASHLLARIRVEVGDEILVKAGRSMVLTPRAQEMRTGVRDLVSGADALLEPREIAPESIQRTFTLRTTDLVLLLLGEALERRCRAEAPGVHLRFLPSVAEDWRSLQDGEADISVCPGGHFPSEFRTRRLFDDGFSCVVRADHPLRQEPFDLDRYLAMEHIVVAPLGLPSAVDQELERRGLRRRIRRTVPYFATAFLLAATSDQILTVSSEASRAMASRMGLRILPPPLDLPGYSLSLLWHPRQDRDPEHRWLREILLSAAEESIAPRDPA